MINPTHEYKKKVNYKDPKYPEQSYYRVRYKGTYTRDQIKNLVRLSQIIYTKKALTVHL